MDWALAGGCRPSVQKGSLSDTELLMPPQLHQCTVGSFQSGARCAILRCARLGLLGTTLRAVSIVERGTTACLAGPWVGREGGYVVPRPPPGTGGQRVGPPGPQGESKEGMVARAERYVQQQ